MKKLEEYRKKRDFALTPEPKARVGGKNKELLFVVQKHAASQLHYDFRIEIGGVLKSWAVPKGPSPRPTEKRLAMPTEDHPMDYANFEGVIPEGQYGGGRVMIWDRGSYENIKDYSLKKAFDDGRIEMKIKGRKMRGNYALVRIKPRLGEKKEPWLLFKMKGDEWEGKEYPEREKSVVSGRKIEEI